MKFLAIILSSLIVLSLASCSSGSSAGKGAGSDPYANYTKTATGLYYLDTKEGTGPSAQFGQTVTLDYIGKLENGTVFENSYQQKRPISFKLGDEEIIKGWNQGIINMKKGGKRILVIPPELGYGSRAVGNSIPANSTLIFEVELIDIK